MAARARRPPPRACRSPPCSGDGAVLVSRTPCGRRCCRAGFIHLRSGTSLRARHGAETARLPAVGTGSLLTATGAEGVGASRRTWRLKEEIAAMRLDPALASLLGSYVALIRRPRVRARPGSPMRRRKALRAPPGLRHRWPRDARRRVTWRRRSAAVCATPFTKTKTTARRRLAVGAGHCVRRLASRCRRRARSPRHRATASRRRSAWASGGHR